MTVPLWLPRTKYAVGVLAGVVLLASIVTGPAIAQPRLLVNPPDMLQAPPSKPEIPGAPRTLLRATPGAPAAVQPPRVHAGVERFYDLAIRMTPATIYDPTNDRNQAVNLRSYVDATKPRAADAPYVAPLINATPGDTVRITLRNQLDPDPSCTAANTTPDVPHCFNGTNLHSHGLWVSPTGNSDNVLLSINPGVSFQYEYNIPADHPAGTFWYHPHRHGSTALQVSSGMAGALIIHGDRKPTTTTNGDLDTLLMTAAHSPYPDHVLLFQQIQYACRYKDGPDKGQIKTKKNDKGQVIAWICDPGDVGEITSYDQFGPPTWAQSARWTSINGEVLPTIAGVEAGSVQRLRLIHAGVRDTIKVQFRKKHAGAAPPTAGLTKQNLQQFLDNTCNGEVIPYQVVAADGLTMENTMTSDAITLQPGYRFDILAVFPEAGDYCMVETSKTQAASVARQDGPPNLLGFVSVTGSVRMPTRDVTKAMTDSLIKSATANMPAGTVRDQVVRDLNYVDPQTHLPAPRLTRFVPHPTVTDDEVKGIPEEHLVFFIGTPDSNTTLFEVGNSFDIEHRPGAPADYYQPKGVAAYDPNRIDRSLTLGTAQQWELRGYAVSHPFHIHVNPFQIVAILDPKGNDVSAPGYKEADGDNQFAGLRGVWKDTIFVKTDLTCYQCGTPSLADPPANYYRFIIRTRYERYIGEFVLHCHILDHEDQGMMQNVMIGISDGAGGMSHGHH